MPLIPDHAEKKGCYFTINTPKTKAGIREIPVSASVERAFEMEKEYQKTVGIKCQAHIDGYTDFVFLNQNGNVHNGNTLNDALRRIIRDCNGEVMDKKGLNSNAIFLPHFSCHVLRHTFATRAAESGVLAPKTLQMLLGHTDITTTFNIYVSCSEQVKRVEITALEKYLKTGKKEEEAAESDEENEEESKEESK